VSGAVDDLAAEEAERLLNLSAPLARRYVARLADPLEGLVVDGGVDLAAMANVIDLRSRHGGAATPESLRDALSEERGLVDDLALDRSG
jgi:hypothetical protein